MGTSRYLRAPRARRTVPPDKDRAACGFAVLRADREEAEGAGDPGLRRRFNHRHDQELASIERDRCARVSDRPGASAECPGAPSDLGMGAIPARGLAAGYGAGKQSGLGNDHERRHSESA